jgi:hypothetical protein
VDLLVMSNSLKDIGWGFIRSLSANARSEVSVRSFRNYGGTTFRKHLEAKWPDLYTHIVEGNDGNHTQDC